MYMPQKTGEIELPRAKNPAQIVREQSGTAHIRAQSLEDAIYA